MKLFNKLFILLLVVSDFACDNSEEVIPDNPFDNMALINTGETGFDAYKVDIYMSEEPFVGYNNIYVDVYDSITNERATDWGLSFAPMMTMMTDLGTMMHSCPLEQPSYNTEFKAYFGAAVFIMPTTDMGNWNFELKYEYASNSGSISFPLTVTEKDNPAMVSFESEADETIKYFIALIEPNKPDVGINEFEIGIYTKESMMSFPSVASHTVVIEPEMPSMGHGSPDNVNPVDSGIGHYKGSVNFTMTGLWRVHMDISNADGRVVKTDASFDIEF